MMAEPAMEGQPEKLLIADFCYKELEITSLS
jgi:hypothetical protein